MPKFVENCLSIHSVNYIRNWSYLNLFWSWTHSHSYSQKSQLRPKTSPFQNTIFYCANNLNQSILYIHLISKTPYDRLFNLGLTHTRLRAFHWTHLIVVDTSRVTCSLDYFSNMHFDLVYILTILKTSNKKQRAEKRI